jgi:acyl transferase domain-containing protein/thioesterase domain-containing protein/acyl carrier protein
MADGGTERAGGPPAGADPDSAAPGDIAIVGMAAHLPGAASVSEYWANLRGGIESIRRFSEEELLAAGETPDRLHHRNYVPAGAPLDGFEMFDGEFFGFSPKEAAIMDPQHRQFLEVAWEALEDAGHPPERVPGAVGVWAGCGMGSYFYFNICSNRDLVDQVGMFLLRHTGNDKDFLSTRVSHILDLKGPSVTIQTACSTSLVAVHYAAQALLDGECDMALAGGVTVELPQRRGYVFQEGEILSPDGHCHAFDHRAAGTVFGSGAGCVVLRRLADALADGDHVWAVIKGTAVNNDGAAKAGYLAPSVDGQAAAVAEAHGVAGVSADTIDYVECHGTGTYLGDPIEVAALTDAFRRTTGETGFCRIGSVKTNIGHLDTAAGVASLIKAALALHNREMPPSLGYEAPNPAIDFETGPFRVNDRLSDWPRRKGPRRAGVNSLGVGGTNAHAVLEEAPGVPPSDESDWPFQPLVLSARSRAALDAASARLAAHLRARPDQPLADVAWTLKEGRRAFERRRVLVAESHEEAARLLEEGDPRRVFTHSALEEPDVVFMFPGGGSQYPGMARDLYETEPVFRDWMDRGLAALEPKLDYDIRALWLPEEGGEAAAAARLKRPSVQLPLIMIVEYALAQLWMSWGVRPAALVGHSMGENAAACLAGVMSFEDCIGLVHLRGTLFDGVPPGGMLSVPLPAGELEPLLGDALDMASVNAPGLSVVSGPQAALDALEARLAGRGIEASRVPIDIAAHSRMLEPILKPFGDYLRAIELRAPAIPIVSNRTGAVLTAEEATDPDYWVGHLRNTVRFADCVSTLAERGSRVYLEMGPGRALASLVQAHGAVPGQQVLNALRHPQDTIADDAHFVGTLARLWALGVEADWEPVWGGARRLRVPLPTYAFQRAPYYIEPGRGALAAPSRPMKIPELADWGWRPAWRPRLADCEIDVETELATLPPETWLLFMDEEGLAARVAARLRAAGHRVVEVRAGDAFARTGEDAYRLAPERGREGYDRLLQDLVARGTAPSRIAHFWLATRAERFRPGSSFFHRNLEQGFYSLLFLAQAAAEEGLPKPLHLSVVTTGAAQVRGEALPYPEKATVAGPVRVIPRELPGITCAALDIELPAAREGLAARLRGGAEDPMERLALRLLEDLVAPGRDHVAAWRGEKRFEAGVRRMPLEPAEEGALPLAEGGAVMITGGFGGVGLAIAEALHARAGAKLVLLARRALPPRDERAGWLRGHGPFDPVSRRIRAVERLESLGAEVMVVAADVCNLEEMRAARAEAEARFGRVSGVVHAAGVIADAPLLAKTTAQVEDVFTPKIHGLQVLETVFPDGALDWLVLFSSTSTITAPAGQVDYVAANEYLNAYARHRAGGATRVVAIDWGIWSGVGMAADAVAERTGERPEPPRLPAGVPLLDEATFDAAGNRLFAADYAPERRWILDEHRTADGAAVVPGTAYLELAAEALAAHGEQGAFEIRDLLFLRPLQIEDGESREIRLRLARSEEGYRFELRSACRVDGRAAFQLHAQAGIALGAVPAPAPLEPGAIEARCPRRVDGGGGPVRSAQEAHLRFGPRWRVIRSMAFGEREGLARLSLPEAARGDLGDGYLLHPALLDLATGWAMELIEGYRGDALWVPVSYARVRVHGALPAEIASWVRSDPANRADGATARFDVTLADPSGRVLLEAEGFTLHRLEGEARFARPRAPSAREVEFEGQGAGPAQPLSPAEERLRHNLTQGILPDEGAEGFLRALGAGLPQVVVSSLDVEALAAEAAEAPAEAEAGQSFARPELDSAYVEPRTDIERTLVGFWEELLGVSGIGVEDSFFDLGGHSLIAVRLFSMVRKAYRADFPISVLFEAPTIAKCAALIAERVGDAGEAEAGGDGGGGARAPAAPARRFTHLVAMHEGEGGPRTPFFLVAGMFGNVLNLRHLAHLVGADRPFYGLQARGLYGGEAPHESLVEAAADYIAELREVQPAGPYMLGGFSGGGITAYEMAQQLRAAGETVSLLVMLDTPLPVRPGVSARDRALMKLQDFREKGPGYLGEWARNRIAWEMRRLRGQAREEAGEAHGFHDTEIEAAFRRAVAAYGLRPWDGPVALFRPPPDLRWRVSGGRWVTSEREYVLEDNGWTPWLADLRVFEVPGDHDSMVLEPNVRVLAARIRACIEEAEAGAAPWPVADAAE